MPILRLNEIREMSSEDRELRLQELRTELTEIKTKTEAGGAIENPGKSKILRKTIAQILTIINEER